MWKPGAERPSPKTPKTQTPKSGSAKEGKSPGQKPSSSAKKRLSGATMNMRFMKRKKEADDHEEEGQKSEVQSNPIPAPNKQSTNPGTPEATCNEKMDIDDGASSSDEFAETTTLGLHGMEAMLVGRRSYGGFNLAVEDVWGKSTAAIDNRSVPSRKISDEELLRQYEAIVKERSGSSRPIANLNGKKGKKKR